MSTEKHKALTTVRANAYGELFGCTPSAVYPLHTLLLQTWCESCG
jgi:hypothetical protein